MIETYNKNRLSKWSWPT